MDAIVAAWDFRRGLLGWTPNAGIVRTRVTPEGLAMAVKGPDPFLTSPPLGKASGPFTVVVLKMRSTGDAVAQLYYGTAFSEAQSVPFAVRNDGLWHEVRVLLPALEAGARLRLDPCHTSAEIGVAYLRVEAHAAAPHEPWATPAELRGKRLIGAGQYTNYGGEKAVTARYLARTPAFLERYPFDGMVLAITLPPAVAARFGLGQGELRLQDVLWNPLGLDDAALAEARADLKRVRWGHVTDNFLNVTMTDGTDGKRIPNLADDRDWAAIEANFAAAARLCRDTGLKGFWLDTEQYANYPSTNLKFPLGKDSDALLRRRGAQWIRAVQRALPDVQILVTFAWSPDANEYGPLKGATPFLNGVLDAIQAPGAIHHAYENTFYYGQGPGTMYAASDGRADGYPGGRARYETAVANIRAWRALSGNPAKYDRFVRTSMAAWVEDDPWNAWDGSSGLSWALWSNAALALSYSEKYVWVWSEHTHYAHGLEAGNGVNPFLAALANQTFNTGREAVATLAEDFARDPLLRGWYFDFDMRAIGKKARPEHAMPTMSPETVPYRWDRAARAVRVDGERPVSLGVQRRRFVRPIRPLPPGSRFRATLDFTVERFPEPGSPPIVLGLFRHDRPTAAAGLMLTILQAERARLSAIDPKTRVDASFLQATPLAVGTPYRLTLVGKGAMVEGSLSVRSGRTLETVTVPVDGLPAFDEIGAALWDTPVLPTAADPAEPYRWRLDGVRLER